MIVFKKTKKIKVRIVIILQFFLYIIFLLSNEPSEIKEKNDSHYPSPSNNELITTNPTFSNEREVLLTRGRKYLDKCLNIENNNFYQYKENPIITTIIPTYNCEKTLSSSIRSVQYQNNSNIEIILIDDFSTDQTKNLIRNIQINDKRIKLIENKKNMGTLYSRSLGALLSKGKYISCLDNDDLFFDEDVFDYIYKQSIKYNLDIASFRALFCNDYFDNISKMKDFHFFGFKNNLSLSQPELGLWTITLNGKFKMHNHMIWSKCIKTDIYKKAVNLLGIQRYSKYLCWAEDTSINFIIFNIAEKFKYIYKFGYIHIVKRISATYTQNINNKLFGELYFLEVMFDFSKNNSEKNFVVNEALFLKRRYKINKYSNNSIYNYLKTILNKIVICPFITRKNRKKIKFKFKSFFNQN